MTAISSATLVAVRAPAFGLAGCLRSALVGLVGLVGLLAGAGCNDLRDFRGTWEGGRISGTTNFAGEDVLRVGSIGGVPGSAPLPATLTIDALDRHGLRGQLVIGTVDTPIQSLAGAEADVLAGMTFDGSPLRVYLAFAAISSDGGGDATAIISLYEDDRVDLRLLRGGPTPLYAIYALERR